MLDVPFECCWSTTDIFELDSARVQHCKDHVASLYGGTACVLLRISSCCPPRLPLLIVGSRMGRLDDFLKVGSRRFLTPMGGTSRHSTVCSSSDKSERI